MNDDFRLDARKYRFLDNPEGYLRGYQSDLQLEPLKRQFRTAKDILGRFSDGRGVLLADDVGLGKTAVGALVAWTLACQGLRVRILAPNAVLRRRWAEELERHLPMLEAYGASYDRIKADRVGKLHPGRIQVSTHSALVKSHRDGELRTACDLMIIDEAHRAKGEGTYFNRALHDIGHHAKRKLILTATPFSIRIDELEQLLAFVGATDTVPVSGYADTLTRLHTLGPGHDLAAEATRLVGAARGAIAALQPFVIRHGIDDLTAAEREHFGAISDQNWEIATPPATQNEIAFLLRMDRLLQLAPVHAKARRNDPRFHVGWHQAGIELEHAAERVAQGTDAATTRHSAAAKKELRALRAAPHPKIAAVSEAIRPLVDAGEKVLLFCHHRATASELLSALEDSLRVTRSSPASPPQSVWRQAWEALLVDHDQRVHVIVDWLCTAGVRAQVTGWLGSAAVSASALMKQLQTKRPRNAGPKAASIADAARDLAHHLLDRQSTSTRAVLASIQRGPLVLGGSAHFPGQLDKGLRTMGSWDVEGHTTAPATLYTGQPDIVLALFNSPFGPDVLVATDRLSEGVDLHRYCRHLIHYELDPSPVRTLQRNGRVRRVGSWAAHTGKPIRYAYPTFGGTRDERAVAIMRQRISAFGLLLGGVPKLHDDEDDDMQSTVDVVLRMARKELGTLNRRLRV